jgi:hypothetical protein
MIPCLKTINGQPKSGVLTHFNPIEAFVRIVKVKRLRFGIKGGARSVKGRQHGNARTVETMQKWSIFAQRKTDTDAFWTIYTKTMPIWMNKV